MLEFTELFYIHFQQCDWITKVEYFLLLSGIYARLLGSRSIFYYNYTQSLLMITCNIQIKHKFYRLIDKYVGTVSVHLSISIRLEKVSNIWTSIIPRIRK